MRYFVPLSAFASVTALAVYLARAGGYSLSETLGLLVAVWCVYLAWLVAWFIPAVKRKVSEWMQRH